MNNIIEVTGCRTCPFNYVYPDYNKIYCSCFKHKIKDCDLSNNLDSTEKPKWCPLKKKKK